MQVTLNPSMFYKYDVGLYVSDKICIQVNTI